MAPVLLRDISAVASLPLTLRLEDRRHACLPQHFSTKFSEDSQYDRNHVRSGRYDTDTSGGEEDGDEVMVTDDELGMNTAPLPPAPSRHRLLSVSNFCILTNLLLLEPEIITQVRQE